MSSTSPQPEAGPSRATETADIISPSPKVSKKQTVDQLKDGLREMGLDTKGKKETLWRRLVNAIHRATARDPITDDSDASEHNGDLSIQSQGEGDMTIRILKQRYKTFLCFDVEATCRPGKEFDWPNEIIEFPVVLLQWTEPNTEGKRILVKVDQFRSYVKPTWKPILTDFCKNLTGISQETVDKAPTFPQMLKKFEKWMDKWELRDEKGLKDALWVTDGPWDLRDFVSKQLHITPPSPFPTYFHGPYLNVKFAVQSVLSELHRRTAYASEHPGDEPNERALSVITTSKIGKIEKKTGKSKDYGKSKGFYFNISGMVEALGLGEFEGRQHSGLDDATNIARILIALSEKDIIFEPNGTIHPLGKGNRYPWMGERGEVKWEDWMSTNKPMGEATSGGVQEAKEAMVNFGKKDAGNQPLPIDDEKRGVVVVKEESQSLEKEEIVGLGKSFDEQVEIGEEEMTEKLSSLTLDPSLNDPGSRSEIITIISEKKLN
ncbi:uncharacterized protein IL334_006611 [Kwoniella shivajii]|uniref:SAP domain-containing protein n=1 Tax=Kwoniella shivajii TaxID=564305 RepID=A0ABZ1D6F6_9TREE|nr:hypothetical protein IL334_006611 [Kwoniella shivajii]